MRDGPIVYGWLDANTGRGRDVRGWLFVPCAKGPAPAITMGHGYAAVKKQGIERFARAFAQAVASVVDESADLRCTVSNAQIPASQS